MSTSAPYDPDFDDGASEVVVRRPLRGHVQPLNGTQIAQAKAGGHMRMMTLAGDAARREFIILRKQGQPAIRITLTHVVAFKALWQTWSEKRVEGVDDPGTTSAELLQRIAVNGRTLALSSLGSMLRGLVRGGAVRSTETGVGWRGRRTLYYPTEAGVQAFALAEMLGDGSFVQVGRTTKSWRSRSAAEPQNLFQHAARISGAAPEPIPVENT
jgi:DNA-binding PadR family transcriptional regulator